MTNNYNYNNHDRIEFWARYDANTGNGYGGIRRPLRVFPQQLDNSFAEVQRTNRQSENLALIRRNMEEEREKHM